MKSVTKMIHEDIRLFPHFLSQNFMTHVSAFNEMSSILRAVNSLNVQSFIDLETLQNITKFINQKIQNIYEVVDIETATYCIDYIRYKIYVYREYWLQEECYEQVENLDRTFEKIFDKKKHII